MPRLYPEALAFCLIWAALAIYAGLSSGWRAGAALTLGLFIVIMPTSALVLSRTGNFAMERAVRWGIFVIAALAFFAWADLNR
jgi:tryptophan-rich sensory protein